MLANVGRRRRCTASASTSRSTTRAPGRRRSRSPSAPQFASYAAAIVRDNPAFRDVIVGNEPNLNRFWMPQFELSGTGASAPAYLRLLAATYDALKAAAPEVRVWGGALAPRGVDKPNTGRDTISPTRFLRELGAAYREERPRAAGDGRLLLPPLPAQLERRRRRPAVRSRSSRADRPGRARPPARQGLRRHGAGRQGMPILYDEFGIESMIPAEKRELYGGVEPTTTRSGPEAAQAAAYRRAIQLAYCQSNVAGMLLFHTHDEPGGPAGSPGSSTRTARRRRRSSRSGAAMELGGDGVIGRARSSRGCRPRSRRRTYDLAPMRARLHLPGPAPAPAASECDRRGDGRPVPRGRRVQVGLEAETRPAGTSSRSRSSMRRCPDGPSSASACPSWCGLLAAALLAGCGGGGSDGPPFLVGA